MKRIRLRRWPIPTPASQVTHTPIPRTFRSLQYCQCRYATNHYKNSNIANRIIPPFELNEKPKKIKDNEPPPADIIALEKYPSPPIDRALKSAKLAALHARLGLPSRLPLQTLARTLIDVTADPSPDFNNASLAVLGGDLLGYYTSEYLICHFPRLPIPVLFAAQRAYGGPEALAAITREWGVDPVAFPGGEVDPGLLQFRKPDESGYNPGYQAQQREKARQALLPKALRDDVNPEPATGGLRAYEGKGYNITTSSRIMYDDQFGEPYRVHAKPGTNDPNPPPTTSLETASKTFVRALLGAIHLHLGRAATKAFFAQHFLSRTLDLASLFSFRFPARDLARLCTREGFEPPVARLISETGRLSSHPAFVVGVYSGRDKLGEGVGGSLGEGKVRAAAAALKGWYLYSPMDVVLPSEVEGGDGRKRWRANMVDCGEIIT